MALEVGDSLASPLKNLAVSDSPFVLSVWLHKWHLCFVQVHQLNANSQLVLRKHLALVIMSQSSSEGSEGTAAVRQRVETTRQIRCGQYSKNGITRML